MLKKYITSILIISIIFTANPVFALSIGIENNVKSYLLSDYNTGEILDEQNIDQIVAIASLSKLMSYMVIMDQVNKGEVALNDIVTIDAESAKIGGSTFDIEKGEQYTLIQLIEGSLILSGNDATVALSRYISGNEQAFVKKMNEKAKEIGLKTATFYNSTGLPVGNRQNQMTTRDLLKMIEYILTNYPEILEITSKKTIVDESRDFFGRNTNSLLYSMENVDGLKTGFTDRAGYCQIVTFIKKGEDGQSKEIRFIAIIMGTDSFETRSLLSKVLVDYGMNTYNNKVLVNDKTPTTTIYVPTATKNILEVYARESFNKIVSRFSEVNKVISVNHDIKLPIKKDQVLGKVSIMEENEIIFETDLIAKEDLQEYIKVEEEPKENPLVEKAQKYIKNLLKILKIGKLFNRF